MEINVTDEFASAMQRLSAEAEKKVPEKVGEEKGASALQYAQILEEFRKLNGRLLRFEATLTNQIGKLAGAEPTDLVAQINKVDEQVAALQSTENANQRLFDSLNQELIKYRDNYMQESVQKPLIRDLLILFDDLNSLSSQLQIAAERSQAKSGKAGQWRNNLENAIHLLTEILHQMEVSEIEPKEMVDRALHRVVSDEPADYAEDDGRIVMRVKRGFFWRNELLRPEEVVAKRFE